VQSRKERKEEFSPSSAFFFAIFAFARNLGLNPRQKHAGQKHHTLASYFFTRHVFAAGLFVAGSLAPRNWMICVR
jgi:hypothetical protein